MYGDGARDTIWVPMSGGGVMAKRGSRILVATAEVGSNTNSLGVSRQEKDSSLCSPRRTVRPSRYPVAFLGRVRRDRLSRRRVGGYRYEDWVETDDFGCRGGDRWSCLQGSRRTSRTARTCRTTRSTGTARRPRHPRTTR